MHEQMSISACMIVKNELETLPACLRTLIGHVDEIVIIDTGSKDGTQALIRGWQKACDNGTKIVSGSYRWRGDFSSARNYSMSKASGDWIFIVDADDRVETENWDEIKKVMESEQEMLADYDLIACRIQNLYGSAGKKMGELSQPRFFRRSSGPKYEGKVHNNITFPKLNRATNMLRSNFTINHIGYGMISKEDLVKKTKRVIRMTKKYVEENPDCAFGWYNYGNALKSKMGNDGGDDETVKETLAALDRACSCAKSHESHHYINAMSVKGWILFVLGRYDEADECAATVLRERPNFIDALLLRGYANADQDRLNDGSYWLKRYLSECEKQQHTGRFDYVSAQYAGQEAEAYKALAAIEFRKRDAVDRRRAMLMR